MGIPLSKNTSLLARPPLVPILKVGGDPLGADAHLSRPHPPLSSRATLYLARGQQGWCVSRLFLIPVHSFVSPPPLRLGSRWPPGSSVALVSYPSPSLLSLGKRPVPLERRSSPAPAAPDPQCFPFHHVSDGTFPPGAGVGTENAELRAPAALRVGGTLPCPSAETHREGVCCRAASWDL